MKAFGRVVFAGALTVGVVIGCGGDDKEDTPAPLPSRDNDPRDSGSSAPALDAEPAAANCSASTTKVSDTPACDTCAKQKCCTEIQKCEKSAACKAAEQCLAACASDDFACGLACSSGPGAELLQEVGACAQTLCKAECPAPPPPDFGDAF